MSTITSEVFSSRQNAELAIIDLKKAGVSDSEISCMYADSQGDMQDGQTEEKVGSGAVAGAATGAAAGGLIGALSNLGISAEDAEMYEKQIAQGGALVISTADDVDAMELFESHNATEIRQYNHED